jgi:hypothetical protein
VSATQTKPEVVLLSGRPPTVPLTTVGDPSPRQYPLGSRAGALFRSLATARNAPAPVFGAPRGILGRMGFAATSAMTYDSQLNFSLPSVSRKKVTTAFDGGRLSSDTASMRCSGVTGLTVWNVAWARAGEVI